MSDVKVDLNGQVAQIDATISFTLGEAVKAYKAGTPLENTIAVDQVAGMGLKVTAELVEMPAPDPASQS